MSNVRSPWHTLVQILVEVKSLSVLHQTPHLDGVHTVFGGIEKEDKESFKVLDSIKQNDKITTIEIKDKL